MKHSGSHAFWKASGSLAGLLFLLAILVAVNVILGGVRIRKDLTEEKLYTLSPGTRSALAKLQKPVTLKFFFNRSSAEIPVYVKTYARQVEELLQEYQIAAGSKVTVVTYDPQPDSDAEEWAQKYGLSPQNMGMFGPQMYLGLVAVSGEAEAALPVLDPRAEGLLEYSITRLIYRVANPEKPTVGVLSSLPVMGGPGPAAFMQPRQPQARMWLALQDLKDDYDLRDIPASAETIDADVDALVVIHPKDLSERTLYALDQFVLRGGRLLAFMDPFCIADARTSEPQQFGMSRPSSTLGKLLTAWGVSYDPEKVVADIKAAAPLRTPDNRVEENPAFLILREANANGKDVLTAGLRQFMMPFAGALSAATDTNLTVTPLFTSSDSAGKASAMTAQFGGSALRRDFKAEPVPLNMGIRLSGTFRTAFPEGQPKAEGDAATNAPPAAAGLKEGKSAVILVGDVDMLADEYCVEELNFFGAKAYQPLNNNLAFFANAVEQLAGSADLIGIRSRGNFARPFDRVDALEQTARRKWQDTEEQLTKELEQTRQKLSSMQTEKDQSQKFILSAKQKEEIANFRQQEIKLNRELKDVRKSLRKEIDTLGVKVKLINIVLMPVLVALGGVAFAMYRRKKR